jgi:non-heme chloroperoxidase
MPQNEITPQEMLESISKAKLPNIQTYVARDESPLFYRHYPADSAWTVTLLHGLAEDGKYLYRLAEFISSKNLAQVYTHDLRGYGTNPQRRGDVDYIGQIDDDLADLMDRIKKDHPETKIIMAGHSFGGASVLRFAGSRYSKQVDAYLFLSPFIHPNAPTIRKGDEGGHSKVSIFKLILLSVLEQIRIRRFHHWKVLSVNKPIDVQHGSETLHISFRLLMSRIPGKYQQDIKSITQPALVLVGGIDELFYPDKIESVFAGNPNIQSKILPQHNHDGILFSDETYKEVEAWLKQL